MGWIAYNKKGRNRTNRTQMAGANWDGITGKVGKMLKAEDTRIKKRGKPRINNRRPRRNGRKGKWRIKVSGNSITGTSVTKERCGKLKKLRRLTTSSSLDSSTLQSPS